MLHAYWAQVGGQIYTEVSLAGRRGSALWMLGPPPDVLGAGRFPGHGQEGAVLPFARHAQEVLPLAEREITWLIEVKPNINCTAIGQVIAGPDLFQKQYGVAPAKLVIVCAGGDAALEWVCERLCERRFIAAVKISVVASADHSSPETSPNTVPPDVGRRFLRSLGPPQVNGSAGAVCALIS